MMKYLEQLRLTLLAWNIAPLSVVGFLCWCVWTLIEYFKAVTCTVDPVVAGGIFTLIGGICGLLYKAYDSMQKNNKQDKQE